MCNFFESLTTKEERVLKMLNTPQKIQTYLESISFNFEKGGETLHSPREVLKAKKAHCFEGALFASAVLLYHHKPAIILDLQTVEPDFDHVVTLFKENGSWGAISKTNHAVLRYRDPVYSSSRELVMSYFHEYFLDNGKKTLRSYATFDLSRIKKNWITDKGDLWYIDKALNKTKHIPIFNNKNYRLLRRATDIEREAGKLIADKK